MQWDGQLTDEHKQEMMKHSNYVPDKIAEHYDELSDNYE